MKIENCNNLKFEIVIILSSWGYKSKVEEIVTRQWRKAEIESDRKMQTETHLFTDK